MLELSSLYIDSIHKYLNILRCVLVSMCVYVINCLYKSRFLICLRVRMYAYE